MSEHNSKIKNLVVGFLLILLPDQANSASADLVCDWTDVESAFATIDVPPAQSENELDSWFDRVAMKHWEAHVYPSAKRPGFDISMRNYFITSHRFSLKQVEADIKNTEDNAERLFCFREDGNCPPKTIAARKEERLQRKERRKREILEQLSDERIELSKLQKARSSCTAAPYVLRYILTFDRDDLGVGDDFDVEWFAESCVHGSSKIMAISAMASPGTINFYDLTGGDHVFTVNRRTLKAGFDGKEQMLCSIRETKTQL